VLKSGHLTMTHNFGILQTWLMPRVFMLLQQKWTTVTQPGRYTSFFLTTN